MIQEVPFTEMSELYPTAMESGRKMSFELLAALADLTVGSSIMFSGALEDCWINLLEAMGLTAAEGCIANCASAMHLISGKLLISSKASGFCSMLK